MMTLLYHSRPQTLGFCKSKIIQPTKPGALKTIARLANEPLECPLKRVAYSQIFIGHKSRKNTELEALDQKPLFQASHLDHQDNLI